MNGHQSKNDVIKELCQGFSYAELLILEYVFLHLQVVKPQREIYKSILEFLKCELKERMANSNISKFVLMREIQLFTSCMQGAIYLKIGSPELGRKFINPP